MPGTARRIRTGSPRLSNSQSRSPGSSGARSNASTSTWRSVRRRPARATSSHRRTVKPPSLKASLSDGVTRRSSASAMFPCPRSPPSRRRRDGRVSPPASGSAEGRRGTRGSSRRYRSREGAPALAAGVVRGRAGEVAQKAVHAAEDLAVVGMGLEKAERLVKPGERRGLGDRRGRERREQPPLGGAGPWARTRRRRPPGRPRARRHPRAASGPARRPPRACPREPSPESEASGAALYARAFRRLTFSGSFGSFLMSPFTSSMNWVTSLNWR